MAPKDITDLGDVAHLIETFYSKALSDELLSPFFAQIDFAEHLPQMIGFWAFILLDIEGYKGSVFQKHQHLALEARHYDQWVELFNTNVDEHYHGEKATLAKQKANLMALTFKSKIS